MAKKRTPEQEDIFQRVLKEFEEDHAPHVNVVSEYDRRYRAYRGLLENNRRAVSTVTGAKFQHPAVILESIDTMVASMLDPSPKWRLRACPILGDPAEIEALRIGARANELLLQHQQVVDKFAEKQRAFDSQGLILGITGAKQFWFEHKGPKRRLETVEEPVYGSQGDYIGSRSRLVERSEQVSYRDDPTTEVMDMRDFIVPENAVSLQKTPRAHHRFWVTYEELEQLERDGIYGPDAGGEPVSRLKDGKGFTAEVYNREQELFNVKRTKDLIEVVETWTDFGRRVVTFGNRGVLLSDKPNPFWFDHLDHQYPFVVASTMPDLFRIPGISEVEVMQELQEMLWTLMNTRLEAVQLLSNAIFLVADDVEDPDSFEFGPGERWLVPRPVDETVKAWSPDVNVPQMTILAEQILRKDIQDIVGASVPFQPGGTSGNDLGSAPATTASIITTLAQKRLAAKKQQYVWARGRIAEHWCALNQQFIRRDRSIPVIGKDGVEAFETIRPEMIQGTYSFQVELIEESMLRQERRAEAQAKLQVAISSVAAFAALSQTGGAPMINLKAFMDDYLEAFDISDTERYYSQATPPPMPQPSPQGAPAPGGSNGGVTNPGLAAGPQAPSNSQSLDGETFMQQFLTPTGGPVNQG